MSPGHRAFRLLLSMSEGLARRVPIKRLAAFGGIAAALLYFAISGGNVAALRATVMIILVFGAVIFGRRALTMRNVSLAALVVLLSDPASVFRPSFQLSFAAVVALIGAWELARREHEKDRSLAGHFFAYFGGLAATIGYTPFFLGLPLLELIGATVLWTLVREPTP